ncbi:hypothetical protein V490_00656, partial [Pseudogymnoascus sp. VKM F-3557]
MKKNKPVEVFINSRIMVDAASFQEINPNYTRPSIFKSSDSIDLWLIVDAASSNQIDESATKSSMDLDALTDEDLLICSPTVLGFSLNDKLWLEFAVADISEISWNESLFNQLAMPSKSKKLIEALTTFQSGGKVKYTFDDFVVGKGRGLIMLLYGPPGVGKTMTAEGLSEHLKRPLYTVSAGNLSKDAKHLEVQLCEMFEVAENWNALLLLDEADDFLCKRSYDSNHNSLVSVFLRKLEYYQGIMLLTTNRVKDFDEAVQSRIHVGLKYGPLGVDTRKEIWRSFLETAKTEKGDAVYSDMQLNSLARHSLNGRQASVSSMETYVPCFKVDAGSMTDMASQYDPRGLSCFNDGTYQSNQFWCLRYELNKCRGSFDEHKQKDISARLTKVQELASFNLKDILETKVDMVVKELLDIARAILGDKHQIRKRSRKLLWRLNGTKHTHCRWHARDREAKASLMDHGCFFLSPSTAFQPVAYDTGLPRNQPDGSVWLGGDSRRVTGGRKEVYTDCGEIRRTRLPAKVDRSRLDSRGIRRASESAPSWVARRRVASRARGTPRSVESLGGCSWDARSLAAWDDPPRRSLPGAHTSKDYAPGSSLLLGQSSSETPSPERTHPGGLDSSEPTAP